MFTVYGQPITFTFPDSLGRYAIEANKPKVFVDAVKMIGTSSGGHPRLLQLARLIFPLNQRMVRPSAQRFRLSKRTSAVSARSSPPACKCASADSVLSR
jgi:hypothetical protein